MALPQSALSELLEAFRAGDGVDLIRESVRVALQELIEAEATERIGAAPYERTESQVTERNGHRTGSLSTKAGDVDLRILKLWKGSFFPVILEPRRRIDQALYAVVMEAYVHGVSAMGVDASISKSEVSRICAGLDETVGAFRARELDRPEFPYVYLDATYLNVRNTTTSQVVSMAVVATGIAANGSREVHARRMASRRPLLSQRGIHGAALPGQRQWSNRRDRQRRVGTEDHLKARGAPPRPLPSRRPRRSRRTARSSQSPRANGPCTVPPGDR
jgi:transposase-like protein